MFTLILTQTISHAFRKGGGAFGTLAFYVLVVTMFTFALNPQTLHEHAGAVMCVALLLASITSLPLLFERDHEDGTLEQLLLQPVALEILVLAKIAGLWVSIMLPILIISPVIAAMAHLDAVQTAQALCMLLLASPSIVAIGAVTAALTLGNKRGGLLQALVALPLYTPVLIFAASISGQGAMFFLAAIACAILPLSCMVCAALIKLSQE